MSHRKDYTTLRWFTGYPLDAKFRTDANWFRKGTKLQWPHPVTRWHYMRWFYRGLIRTGSTVAPAAWVAGYVVNPQVTLGVTTIVGVAVAYLAGWWLCRRVRHFRHLWRYVWPLRRAITPVLEHRPRLEIPADRSKVKIWLPPEIVTDKQWEQIDHAVHVKVGIESPARQLQLVGPKPFAVLTHSPSAPGLVHWAGVAEHTRTVGPDELVVGIGKGGKLVKVSLKSDSPHFGISMGTGAGKSNLAAFWLMQELMRGSIALVLDAKQFSHPWAFKDMDAEYGQLPNIGYARRTSDMHDAMVWLGSELERRNQVAERIIDAKGVLHGSVGPRLWVVAEELNMATPLLKQHWAEMREKGQPKKSPALSGLAQVAFAGRAVKMHLIVIGQQLTAETLGGGAVRENIGVRCLARYGESSWKMLVGKDVPMPPSPVVDGRVQVVTGTTATEAQTPLMDLEEVRELAVSGVVTPCPAGMPGIAVPAPVPVRLALPVGSDGVIDLGMSEDIVPDSPVGITLQEAIRDNVLPSNGDLRRALAALQKASQRPGFPPKIGDRRNARIWDRADLYAYAHGERWR